MDKAHDLGQVSIPRHSHDRLDEAVAAAHGWPADLPAAGIAARVVALNTQRQAEETGGLVRWLRPEFQAPEAVRRVAIQSALDVGETTIANALQRPRGDTARQYIVPRGLLTRATVPAIQAELARHGRGAPRGGKTGEMPRVLTAPGQARDTGGGRFTA